MEKVGLYKPYDENFNNRLPKYMDVVVVLFSLPLANSDYRDTDDPIKTLTNNVPLWVDRASDLDQGTSLSFARIAGRCLTGWSWARMGNWTLLPWIQTMPVEAGC